MYDELLMPLLLNGKALLALVDTGSNITLLHKSVVGDSDAPGHGLPFSVDFGRTRTRRVAFMSGVGVSRDALATGLRSERSNRPLERDVVVTIVDLHESIQNFPRQVDMIVGTNALASRLVSFTRGGRPELLTRAELRALKAAEPGLLEIGTLATMCDLPGDSLGPLFMVRIHNAEKPATVFLADTGNKFSSFCLDNGVGSDTEEEDPGGRPAVCGVGFECFECGETNAQIAVRGLKEQDYRPLTIRQKLKKIPPPSSLTSIENWCRDAKGRQIDIQGNLGIDFWAGHMRLTVFDFDKRKIFCVPAQ